MTDQKFIDSILTGGGLMHKTIEWFYHENFGLVYQMVGSHKLVREDALDAYSDAVTAFVENIRYRKFRGDSKCRTYFIRIFHNKCIDIIRKKATNRMDKETISLSRVEAELIQEVAEDESISLPDFMAQLSEICREVLMDWSDGYPMEEIAVRNGLRNAHTARSKRYNCFRQLMEILKRDKIVGTQYNLTTDG